ncbi:MAG: hypothetical protein F6K54_14575 [Okeania sp. SIO3B5]|uniref:GUN4 domain-containing protein n=1 Tax=Okeania sp. SIO3B5 TaxID=2607811 RepID=UPI0014000D45|nr:GUN4 domain-containing protein [Okeania sp. SIO3B5]NEO54198.1 hypothetical protein [Okeania sp. SIO3B5]
MRRLMFSVIACTSFLVVVGETILLRKTLSFSLYDLFYFDVFDRTLLPGFSEGLVAIKIGNKWGFIDRTGKMVISPQFDKVENFWKGLAPVKIGDESGYIDKTGRFIWPSGLNSELLQKELDSPPRQDPDGEASVGASSYPKLEKYLSQQQFWEADIETRNIMFKIAGKEYNETLLDSESINNFPCKDLRAIDQLWIKYSGGKFGFSVQKKIYQNNGGKINQSNDSTRDYDTQVWKAFGSKVGWREGEKWLDYTNLTYNLNTPYLGHLPRVGEIISTCCLPGMDACATPCRRIDARMWHLDRESVGEQARIFFSRTEICRL